jgi:origin recognition complex subunit 4
MPAAVKPAAVKPAAVKPAAVRPAAVKPAAVKPAAPKPTPRKAKAPVKSKRKEAAIEEAVLDVNTDDVNREEEEEEEEEEYHSELPEVSRESFLANEALKRQREARNFKYKGDANAPTLTRSGKVVGKANVEKEPESQEEDEADVYGTMETDPAVDDAGLDIENPFVVAPVRRVSPALAPLQPLSTTLVPKPSEDQAESYSILPGARPYLHKILLTLTSAGTSTDPAPFPDEGTHEALQGLVNLLRGTVERGEGNSALIVGARGVGKTRVSGALPEQIR